MDDFEKALLAHAQQRHLCAVIRVNSEGGIAHIVDVVGSDAQARIVCDKHNERFAKVLHPYQWVSIHDFDVHGNYIEIKELTVFKEFRTESVLALRRPQWLQKLVAKLDRLFTS